MTIEKLCRKCEALNKEFNAAAKKMDGAEFSAFRKRLMFKYDVGFENSWTVRFCRNVSDVFNVEQAQVWTRTEKGRFGRSIQKTKIRLTLISPVIPELRIRCIASDGSLAQQVQNGTELRISGELEASVFLHPEGTEWKSAEFLKCAKVSRI